MASTRSAHRAGRFLPTSLCRVNTQTASARHLRVDRVRGAHFQRLALDKWNGLHRHSLRHNQDDPPETRMTEPLVIRTDRDGLATLTLNRPAKLNALTPGLFVQLRAHLDALAQDDSIGCVVLR